MNKVAFNVLKGVAIIATIISGIVSICGIIVMALLFSSCNTIQEPSLSIDLPYYGVKYDNVPMDTSYQMTVLEGDSLVNAGDMYVFSNDEIKVYAYVFTNGLPTELMGVYKKTQVFTVIGDSSKMETADGKVYDLTYKLKL